MGFLTGIRSGLCERKRVAPLFLSRSPSPRSLRRREGLWGELGSPTAWDSPQTPPRLVSALRADVLSANYVINFIIVTWHLFFRRSEIPIGFRSGSRLLRHPRTAARPARRLFYYLKPPCRGFLVFISVWSKTRPLFRRASQTDAE